MLTELFVKNFAIIDEIRLTFEAGFSVISGETGAGKSILVGALGLILGDKASGNLIRSGEAEAIVEGVFDIENQPHLLSLLREADFEDEGKLVIRRHISSEGRNRIYINSRAAPLNFLEKIGAKLVDLASQHDQQILLREENHLGLLDSSDPRLLLIRKEYDEAYLPYETLKKEVEEWEKKRSNRENKIDYLKFQVAEIERAHLSDPDEEEKLSQEKVRVKNSDFLISLSCEGHQLLEAGDKAVLDSLDSLITRLEKGVLADTDLKNPLNNLKEGRAFLADAGEFLRAYSEKIHAEPGRLEVIEARLFELHGLKKKFGGTIAEVINQGIKLKKELSELENLDESLVERRKAANEQGEKLLHLAKKLSVARKERGKRLSCEIGGELAELAMPQVRFGVKISSPTEPPLAHLAPTGYDQVCFDLSANPGEEPKPLASIASGGELSRIFLAIKKILGGRDGPITYIFDEIDAGIGGGVAYVVGRKLKELSQKNQVIVVTHLPQIASMADAHYVIEKNVVKKRTETRVRLLSRTEERETEISRMLGGMTITEKTRAHAREMLKGAGG